MATGRYVENARVGDCRIGRQCELVPEDNQMKIDEIVHGNNGLHKLTLTRSDIQRLMNGEMIAWYMGEYAAEIWFEKDE